MTIKIQVHQKPLNEKKIIRLFNKKALLYAGIDSKQQTFSNCQATYQKELCLLFEKSGKFFHRVFFFTKIFSDRPDRHVRFRSLFKDPPPSPSQPRYFLNTP